MRTNLFLFVWGQETFEKTEECLFSPLVLWVHRWRAPFKLYVVVEEKVIGVVLAQDTEGKEYIIITYVDC